jgi:hypothetical protein
MIRANSNWSKQLDDSKMVEYVITAVAGCLYRGGWRSGVYAHGFNTGGHIRRLGKEEGRHMSSRDWCNGLGLAQIHSSTSWDSSCTVIYICSSPHLR